MAKPKRVKESGDLVNVSVRLNEKNFKTEFYNKVDSIFVGIEKEEFESGDAYQIYRVLMLFSDGKTKSLNNVYDLEVI